MIATTLDLILGLAVVWLAWMALASRDLFRAVVLYIVFGLVMALSWARLRAPDIALAEAAIGAGLTGALLLDAAAQFGEGERRGGGRLQAVLGPVAALAVVAVGVVLVLAVMALPVEPGGLTRLVAARLEESGVGHPTTAVLLNFRAFDTWLELGVLLVAVLATMILRRSPHFRDTTFPPAPDPLLGGLPTVLVPLMVLTGGYLLWLGTHAPGGAFQSGAILASAAVLLMMAGYGQVTAVRTAWLRIALVAGVLAFLVVGVGTMLIGGTLLELPPDGAGALILAIEAAVTVSIAATLALMFAGARVSVPASGARGPGDGG